MTVVRQSYNTAAIRQLLNASFDDVELIALCQDNFSDLCDKLGRGLRKDEILNVMIDHFRRQREFAPLLRAVKARKPEMYASFELSLFDSTSRSELGDPLSYEMAMVCNLPTMSGLTAELHHHCRSILLKCGELDSNTSLRAVFVTKELYPFRSGLPDAASRGERVDMCLDFLLLKRLSGGRPVLPLFLAALRDRYQVGDALRDELGDLVEAIQSALVPSAPPSSVGSLSQPVPILSPQTVTWLHLSDLHFRESRAYDENIVLKAFLRDVAERIQVDNLQLDFIVITGDLAFSGKPVEYTLAHRFLDELLVTTGLGRERLFVVPGNHDVNRSLITTGAKAIGVALTDRDNVNTFLATPDDRRLVMARFKGYANFINGYFANHLTFDDERYFYVRTMDIAGQPVALLGLNSAWICASDEDKSQGLLIGERQAWLALQQAENADLKIALLHHPFDWLREFDQNDSATQLLDNCNFVLHGHLHRAAMTQLISPDSGAMVIASGACYETRQYPNSYNFVRLDLSTGSGQVYLRRYSDERGGFWAKDTLTYRNVPDGVYSFTLRRAPASETKPIVPVSSSTQPDKGTHTGQVSGREGSPQIKILKGPASDDDYYLCQGRVRHRIREPITLRDVGLEYSLCHNNERNDVETVTLKDLSLLAEGDDVPDTTPWIAQGLEDEKHYWIKRIFHDTGTVTIKREITSDETLLALSEGVQPKDTSQEELGRFKTHPPISDDYGLEASKAPPQLIGGKEWQHQYLLLGKIRRYISYQIKRRAREITGNDPEQWLSDKPERWFSEIELDRETIEGIPVQSAEWLVELVRRASLNNGSDQPASMLRSTDHSQTLAVLHRDNTTAVDHSVPDWVSRIPELFIKQMEEELRMNEIYWQEVGFQTPEWNKGFTFAYFSQQASKLFELREATDELHNNLKSANLGNIQFIEQVYALLDQILERTAQIGRLIGAVSQHPLGITTEKTASRVAKDAQNVKRALSGVALGATSGSGTPLQLRNQLAMAVSALIISLDDLRKYLQEIGQEAQLASYSPN